MPLPDITLPDLPTLDSFLALLPFNAAPAAIVAVTPISAPIKAVLATDFEITPFLEKVLIDPYKTAELAVLSQAELAIDDVVSYVESLIPADLLAEIMALPGLAERLLAEGTTLVDFITNIIQQIPKSIDIGMLLRSTSLMHLADHIKDLMSAIDTLMVELDCVPTGFIADALAFMDDMANMLDVAAYMSDFNLGIDLTCYGVDINLSLPDFSNFGCSGCSNPVAYTAVGVATASGIIKAPNTYTNKLAALGVPQPRNLLPILYTTTATQFPILANGVQIAGQHTVNNMVLTADKLTLVKYIDIINGLAGSYSDTLLTYNTEHTAVVKFLAANAAVAEAFIDILTIYDINEIIAMVDFIDKLGAANITRIIGIINQLTAPEVETLLQQIAELGVAGYLATYNTETTPLSPELVALIDTVTVYGITVITDIQNIVTAVGTAVTAQIITAVSTIGITEIYNILQIITGVTTAGTVAAISPVELKQIVVQINQNITTIIIDTHSVLSRTELINVLAGINALTAPGLIALLTAFERVDTTIALNSIAVLASLTVPSIIALTLQLNSNEVYNILINRGITGIFLLYAIKKSAELSSEVGNYKIAAEVLTNYTGTVTVYYRRYIVTKLLASYKTNVDDITLGPTLAAYYFAKALYGIYSDWDITIRDKTAVAFHTPWLTASNDALLLLSHYPKTAIAAQLQLDNTYRLTY